MHNTPITPIVYSGIPVVYKHCGLYQQYYVAVFRYCSYCNRITYGYNRRELFMISRIRRRQIKHG